MPHEHKSKYFIASRNGHFCQSCRNRQLFRNRSAAWKYAICNQYISDNLQKFITQNANGYREINFGHLPAFACGGTHVESLAEIIEISIAEYKLKKGKLTIHYKISDEHP